MAPLLCSIDVGEEAPGIVTLMTLLATPLPPLSTIIMSVCICNRSQQSSTPDVINKSRFFWLVSPSFLPSLSLSLSLTCGLERTSHHHLTNSKFNQLCCWELVLPFRICRSFVSLLSRNSTARRINSTVFFSEVFFFFLWIESFFLLTRCLCGR